MEECVCVYSCGEGLRDGAWVNGEAKRVEEMNQKKLYCVEGGEGVCPHRYIASIVIEYIHVHVDSEAGSSLDQGSVPLGGWVRGGAGVIVT